MSVCYLDPSAPESEQFVRASVSAARQCSRPACEIAMAQQVEFTENRLGGVALVIDGCKYRINRRAGTTVYWRCFYRWCRANAVVEGGKLKSACGKHICDQPLSAGSAGRGSAAARGGRQQQRQLHGQQQQQQQSTLSPGQAEKHSQNRHTVEATPSGSNVSELANNQTSRSAVKMPARTGVLAARNGAKSANKSKPRSQTKAACNSAQTSATNNNSVVRRKSKKTDQENKSNGAKNKEEKPESPEPENGHDSDSSSLTEVRHVSFIFS